MGLASPVTAAVRGVGATVDRLDRILCSLETLGGSIAAIDAPRGDVRNLDGSVGGIRDATVSLEEEVISLGRSLKRIDSMVPRLSRRPR